MNKLYKINQLDSKLSRAAVLKKLLSPKQGWIATIRNTLEMSRAHLAKKMGLTRDAIQKIEHSEIAHAITLKTLEKTASAMGCDLYYILLPKGKSLSHFVTQQAKKIAETVVKNSAKHMVLENQGALKKINEQVDLLTDELLHHKLKDIWKYEI